MPIGLTHIVNQSPIHIIKTLRCNILLLSVSWLRDSWLHKRTLLRVVIGILGCDAL